MLRSPSLHESAVFGSGEKAFLFQLPQDGGTDRAVEAPQFRRLGRGEAQAGLRAVLGPHPCEDFVEAIHREDT
jgi:hypothetical protein